MSGRETIRPLEFIHADDDWKLTQTSFDERDVAQAETLTSLGNGYLGLRGNLDEGAPVHQNGTFVNGFHDTWPIVYGEDAYGFARTGQTILNVPDGKTLTLSVDGETFDLSAAAVEVFERTLDMQAGTLDRRTEWTTRDGKRVLVESRRLVSFVERHLAAISYRVTVLDAAAQVVVSSRLASVDEGTTDDTDPRRARGFRQRPLLPGESRHADQRVVLGYRTRSSGMTLGCGADHTIDTTCPYTVESHCVDDLGVVTFTVDAVAGERITITKYLAYHTSNDAPVDELCARADRTLDHARSQGFRQIFHHQRRYLDEFWRRSDVQIDEAPAVGHRPRGDLQQAIRWNLFQVLQASARAETVGVAAKGLTGQTYEGHSFWDTEIYVLPFLVYTNPHVAANLLRFRHGMLDEARRRAAELHQKGALFPWRTITGEEASAHYPAGTAQYHIDADIVYGLKKYVEATGDSDFLFTEGVEMLVETARMWSDLGFFSQRQGGKFCIHRVTGPDEYSAVVDDNLYTNLMARLNLRFAAASVDALGDADPERFDALVRRTGLDRSEVAEWLRAAEAMHLPYDDELGIHPQDADFLEHEVWDFEGTPADRYPLLLHYHPLTIYRHQVLKQADVVLAMFLVGDEFTLDEKRRNFEYYDPLTTGDSSLSAAMQSIVAAEIGDMDVAMGYGRHAVLMDLADLAGNLGDGCHIASMGGTWQVMVNGFGGMRDFGGNLSFRPRLPDDIGGLRFALTVRGQLLHVAIDQTSATYTLREGTEMVVRHFDESLTLTSGEAVTRRIPTG